MASAIDNGVVLVTGASSGIGMAIARLIAPRAKLLALVARRTERLEALKEELVKANASLQVEVFSCDLSDRNHTKRFIEEVKSRGVDVEVLVNNAGVGLMGTFDHADPDRLVAMIDLNVTSTTLLARAFLPAMVARGRGGILNVSSGFGVAVMPSFAAYIATKHYVTGLTEGLIADLAGTGVVVTQILPGPVATEFEQQIGNFTGMKPPGLVEITAESCAKVAVRAFDRRRAMVVPGLIMKLLLFINAISPRFLRRAFASLLGLMARRKQLGSSA